jgi:hypothetical protein
MNQYEVGYERGLAYGPTEWHRLRTLDEAEVRKLAEDIHVTQLRPSWPEMTGRHGKGAFWGIHDSLLAAARQAEPGRELQPLGESDQRGTGGGRKAIRLSIDLPPELNDTLEMLADKLFVTKSDVVRRALALLEVAIQAKDEKKRFGVAAPGQTLEREILLP